MSELENWSEWLLSLPREMTVTITRNYRVMANSKRNLFTEKNVDWDGWSVSLGLPIPNDQGNWQPEWGIHIAGGESETLLDAMLNAKEEWVKVADSFEEEWKSSLQLIRSAAYVPPPEEGDNAE